MKTHLIGVIGICLLSLTTATLGSVFMVGANVGQSILSEDFEKPLSFGGRVSFAAQEGFILEGSAGYFDAESKKEGVPSLKAATGLATFCYMIPIKSKVRPYIGASGGLSFLSNSYETPAFTYGAKGGFMMNVSKDTKVYIEVSQLMIDSSISDVSIQPLTVGVGLGIAFGGNQLKAGLGKRKRPGFQNRRKPRQRSPRRKPSPRGRR